MKKYIMLGIILGIIYLFYNWYINSFNSYCHKNMLSLDNEQLLIEIATSKEIMESRTGKNIKTFSYPYGKHNDNIKNIVKKSGYKAACCSITGSLNSSVDLFELRRTEITKYDSLFDFKQKLKGCYDWLSWMQMREINSGNSVTLK